MPARKAFAHFSAFKARGTTAAGIIHRALPAGAERDAAHPVVADAHPHRGISWLSRSVNPLQGRRQSLMEFEYDPEKSMSNRTKHGSDFIAAQRLWEGRVVGIESPRPPEMRYRCIGVIDGKHASKTDPRRR